MRIANEQLTLSGTSMAVDITSDPIWLGHICNLAIQVFYSGTPDGTFTLQASNDPGNPQAAQQENEDYKITHWSEIGGSAAVITDAGDTMWNLENAGYRWVRLVWTADSAGTAPLITSAIANMKGI